VLDLRIGRRKIEAFVFLLEKLRQI